MAEAFIKMISTVKGDLTELKEKDVEKVLNEIDSTKVDEVVRNEGFITKNIRVKPVTNKERLRTAESPLNSKRSFHESETIEVEGENNLKEEHEPMESYRVQVKTKIFEDNVKVKKQ